MSHILTLTGDKFPIIRNAVSVESNMNPILLFTGPAPGVVGSSSNLKAIVESNIGDVGRSVGSPLDTSVSDPVSSSSFFGVKQESCQEKCSSAISISSPFIFANPRRQKMLTACFTSSSSIWSILANCKHQRNSAKRKKAHDAKSADRSKSRYDRRNKAR